MKRKPLSPIFLCDLLAVSACNLVMPVNLPATATVIPSQLVLSPTNIPEATFVITQAFNHFTTITPINTLQPTPPSTPTWTPRPTLPSYAAQLFALKIFKANGDCLLPCWIGISPGKTTWNEAYAFLSTFADDISSRDNLQSNVHVVHFKFPNTSYRGVSETGATINLRDGIVDMIDTPTGISLSELLSTYGFPDEIRIRAIGYSTIESIGRFTLILFYKDKGIMAVYVGINEKSKIIHICPNHIQGPQLAWLLWSSADHLTFSEAGRKTLLISDIPPPAEEDYIPLEKLTNLSIEAFTQRYKDPKNQGICIEMQAPDWP